MSNRTKQNRKGLAGIGKLHITLIDAKGLTTQENGPNNIYANVRIVRGQNVEEHSKQKTPIVKGPGGDPVWNFQIYFSIHDLATDWIQFHLWVQSEIGII